MSVGEGSGIPASCYLAPPRPRAGTEPLARLPSSFEGGGYCSSSSIPSPSAQGDGSSSGDLSPAAALCSLANAVKEQRKQSGALAMTPEAQAVKKAIIASTTSSASDWHPLIPLNFTLPPHYLPVSPSKMPPSQKRAAIKAAEEAAAAKGEKLDSSALAAIPMFSSHEPTLRLTRVYCGIQKRVYFEVYPHVYELYKLKSSQDRKAMLKEMMELVSPPERVVLPLPNLAATGRKPHPCILITAEGLRQVALKMKNSTPDIVAVLTNLYNICARESVADLLNQAEVLHPDLVVMGQTWQRAWSGDEAPQISATCDTLLSPSGGPGEAPTDSISTAVLLQQTAAQEQTPKRVKKRSSGKPSKQSNSSSDESNGDGEDGDTEDNVDHHTIGTVPVGSGATSAADQDLYVPSQRRRVQDSDLSEPQQRQPPIQSRGLLMPPAVSDVHEVLSTMPPMQQKTAGTSSSSSEAPYQPLNMPKLECQTTQVYPYPVQGQNWHC